MSDKMGKDLPLLFLCSSNLMMFAMLKNMEEEAGQTVMDDPQLVRLRKIARGSLITALLGVLIVIVGAI